MGMFDSVYIACPICGYNTEVQSKAGDRNLKNYTLDTAPPEVLLDISKYTQHCPQGHVFHLRTQTIIRSVAIVGPVENDEEG